ncbi:MAG: hypothetical protein LBB14_00925, partial [Puniceicoccales bacterium]|nr:hypothetical protein [Puniceicoccales bacterium]
ELSELLRRLASDLKSRGANFLVQSVMDSLSRLPGISNIAVPIMKANDMAIDVLNKGLGGGDGKKKNR